MGIFGTINWLMKVNMTPYAKSVKISLYCDSIEDKVIVLRILPVKQEI